MGFSGTEPLSAPLPSPLEDGPSGPGAHPLAEAMVFLPFSGIWLIGSLHCFTSKKTLKDYIRAPAACQGKSLLTIYFRAASAAAQGCL